MSEEEFSRDLERHLRGLPLESRGGVFYRLGKLAWRPWKGLAAGAVVLVFVAVLASEELERRQLERENQRVGRVAYDLGDYLYKLLLRADSTLWEAQGILTLHHPGDHRLIAIQLNSLAGVEKELGYVDEAVEHYRGPSP